MESIDKLKSAFQESMPLGPEVDFERVEYGKTEGWDSVAHMALIAQIEMVFDIMLATEDVIDLSSFGRAKEILGKYGVTLA